MDDESDNENVKYPYFIVKEYINHNRKEKKENIKVFMSNRPLPACILGPIIACVICILIWQYDIIQMRCLAKNKEDVHHFSDTYLSRIPESKSETSKGYSLSPVVGQEVIHHTSDTHLSRIPERKSEQVKRCTLSPVVVVGCGHSGTSILHMLLSSHPDAYSVSSDISNESGELVTDNVHSIVDASNRFTAECDKAGKRWWVEKTPSNVHHIEAIMRAIPHARIVVIYRNGYDVAKSLQRRFCLRECEEDKALLKGVTRWKEDNDAALVHIGDPRVHFIQYEALTTRPNMELHGLCTFLQIPYEPAAMLSLGAVKPLMDRLNPPIIKRTALDNVKLRLQQMQNPLQKYTSYHMTAMQQKIIRRVANSTLVFFGYRYEHEMNLESKKNTPGKFVEGNIKEWVSKMSRSLGFDVGSIYNGGSGIGVYAKTRDQSISQIHGSIVSKEYLVEDHHRYYGAPWYQGREAFNFLINKAGLQPGNTVLEVGCGSMRIGVWITAFTEVGRYNCIEPDKNSLQHGVSYEVPLHGLIGKDPRFSSNAQFDLSTFGDTVFDFVLMHAVDIHLSHTQSLHCFLELAKRMRPGGRILVSHSDPKVLQQRGANYLENSIGFRKTRTFWEECEMYSCRGACFDDPKCENFNGYKWVELTRI
jgi:SAM-dependent methyltransferase